MALISIVQNYTVERKKLLSPEDMLGRRLIGDDPAGPVAVNVVATWVTALRGVTGALVSDAGNRRSTGSTCACFNDMVRPSSAATSR